MDLNNKLQLAYQKIKEADNILIIGHVFPDADALASVSLIRQIAEDLDKKTYCYAEHKPDTIYNFIPYVSEITNQAPVDIQNFSLIIILDCGSISRTNLEREIREVLKKNKEDRPYIIEFDHHESITNFADLEIRLPEKASTTVIIHDFLESNKLSVSKDMASCILVGIMADTGNFFHSNSSSQVLEISSKMLSCGASLPDIINNTVYNKDFSSLKIWGRVLSNMIFNKDTGFVVSALTEKELQEFAVLDNQEFQIDLFSDLASFLNSLEGVSVALLLRENGDIVKGSLRTNIEQIDVSKIAHKFGGGGHKKAAGFSIEGKLKKDKEGWSVVKKK